ncbi:hypothetical protein [Streptomyces atratus]|uniref:hypothetical protein n=1 Tax=Streptomyces atratus TaxID=1893 RepID=UPI003650BE5B
MLCQRSEKLAVNRTTTNNSRDIPRTQHTLTNELRNPPGCRRDQPITEPLLTDPAKQRRQRLPEHVLLPPGIEAVITRKQPVDDRGERRLR